MDEVEADRWARTLLEARREKRTLSPISKERPLTMADAYDVQRAMTALRLGGGQRVAGWKLGYTSLAMREQMGVDEPNFGPLTDVMFVRDGDAVGGRATQPRVEPEIAVRLARPLEGDVDRDQVRDALDAAVACLEVVDSVYTDYRFTIEDNTADGSSACLVVLGDDLPSLDGLEDVAVELQRNGEPAGSATGAAASGHPLNGVAWLVGQLAGLGLRLEAGDVVITGGLTAAVPLGEGDEVAATFDDRVRVSIRR